MAEEQDSKQAASDKLVAALWRLLEICGLEKGCNKLQEEDFLRLTQMIDLDSINYSPPKTFSDAEIAILLDFIRKGC